MTTTWRSVLISAVLLTKTMVAGQDVHDTETLMLPPMQVLAKSVEMVAHHSTHQGKKTLEYIRVNMVAKGSMADHAGLKKGDRIVAIGGWRLEGQELTALNRDFPTQRENGEAVLILTVRRPRHDEEHDVVFRYPYKKLPPREPNQYPTAQRP